MPIDEYCWTEDTFEPGWRAELGDQLDLPYFTRLVEYLAEERKQHTIYPSPDKVFLAFDLCPFKNVRVVVLGQDPYHGAGQAHGLAFSVPKGVVIPSSLHNIIAEVSTNQDIRRSGYGDLTCWAAQGILLLNTTLTVREGCANSHQKEGWATFTDHVIKCINVNAEGVVFLLWGRHAQRKGRFIDKQRHCVLETSHPSGLSCHRGFKGSKCFSKTNEYLEATGKVPIDWSV